MKGNIHLHAEMNYSVFLCKVLINIIERNN